MQLFILLSIIIVIVSFIVTVVILAIVIGKNVEKVNLQQGSDLDWLAWWPIQIITKSEKTGLVNIWTC